MTRPTTAHDYLVGLFDDPALRIDELRELSRRSAPGAEETIKWGSPAMVHPDGTILFVYSAHKHHANVTFTPSTREAFAHELRECATGEGSVKLPYGQRVPTQLLERMIAHRIREYEDDGVTWM